MKSGEISNFQRFIILWIGESISCIGTGLTAFALSVYVFEMTGLAMSVSLITICSFLPIILLAPLTGVLADRYDRRLLMFTGDALSSLGIFYILGMVIIGNISLIHICIGITFSSIAFSLVEPAYKATVTDLLTEDQFAKASGLLQLASSSKFLISPIIAGFLIHRFDIKLILMLDILSFITTTITILYVKRGIEKNRKKVNGTNLMNELTSGFRIIISQKGVLSLVLLISLVTFYIGFAQTLLTPMIISFTDSQTLGTIMSVSAVGMLVGGLFIGGFSLKGSYVKILSVSLGLLGIFLSLMGIRENVILITLFGFLFFLMLPFVNTCCEVLVRKNIPNEVQGRAWGAIGIMSQFGFIIAYAISGIIADNLFIPLLLEDGVLSKSIGRVIGIGSGRGIGLLFVISGIFIVILSLVIYNNKNINLLERTSTSE